MAFTSFLFEKNGIKIRVGNTPVLRIEINGVEFFAKAEWFNCFELPDGFIHGSVKMRAACFMLNDYISRHGMKPLLEKVVVEPSSGNTGIALAAFAKLYGFRFMPVVSHKATEEVKETLTRIGFPPFEVDDRLYPISSATATDQAIAFVGEVLMRSEYRNEYIWLNQFENEANPKAHEKTTSEEIAAFGKVSAVVTGIGTGGTYVGLKRGLAKHKISVIGVQPHENSRIQGLRNLIGSAFIPKILEREAINARDLPTVKEEEALEMIEKILAKYDLLVGLSSGVTAYHAYQLAKNGKKVIAIFADTGQNYKNMYEELGLISPKFNFRKLYETDNLPVASEKCTEA